MEGSSSRHLLDAVWPRFRDGTRDLPRAKRLIQMATLTTPEISVPGFRTTPDARAEMRS